MKKIVVGTDGSPHSAAAMRWAAEEAELHESSLEVVLAWHFLDQHEPDRSAVFDPAYDEERARSALAAWVEESLGSAVVDQRVELDVPARALLEASDAADLLVLGARGTGGFEGLILGSTSERVAQLATRPVAIVREPAAVHRGRVVVGIDGSVRSLDALRWAATEARARDADLDVVHAWQVPAVMAAPAFAPVPDYAAIEASRTALVDNALADAGLADDVRARAHLVHGSPARAIMERAAGAGLVVVGTRGRGRLASALLGSVSRQLLQHAPCPIVVI